MKKKKQMIIYEFANFHPRRHRTKHYIIALVAGTHGMYNITPQVFKHYKKHYKVKIKKVV